jgi:hypothetical protein
VEGLLSYTKKKVYDAEGNLVDEKKAVLPPAKPARKTNLGAW